MRDLSTRRSNFFGTDSHCNAGPLKLDLSWGFFLMDRNDDTIDTLKERTYSFMSSISKKLYVNT